MGIGGQDLSMLIRLREDGYIPSKGAVCDIGAQQLGDGFLASRAGLETIARQFSVREPCPLPAPLSDSPSHLLSPAAPFARTFWNWLGFDYAAIDIDGSPGSIPLDLNCDEVPDAHKGRYHLVANFGTTEHVANQLNAFKVIHDLTAPGGLMFHVVPAQGHFDHGLVNYNPKFFWLLARSNDYVCLHSDFEVSRSSDRLPRDVVETASKFVPDFAERTGSYRAADGTLRNVFLKHDDRDYVAPLDVDTGTRTEHDALKERYWPVFDPGAIDRLEAPRNRTWRGRVGRLLRP
jgi:SAM-dependent methyltransferase